MILKKLIPVLFIILIFSCQKKTKDLGFSLSGKTVDIEAGTYLYFRDLVNGGDIDSALVQNNKFKFSRDLPEPNLMVMLFSKDKSYTKELWLEDKPMTFDATKTDFRNAKVTGSETQDLLKERNKTYNTFNENSNSTLKEREKEFIKKQKQKEFINKHRNSLLSAYILHTQKKWSQDEVSKYYSKLSEEIQTSSLGNRIQKYLEKDIPGIGETYADFSVPNSKGQLEKISDLTGKLTLLQFWSSNSHFSRNMNTALTDLYPKYHPQGFEIVSISGDNKKDNWIQAIENDKLN